MSQQRVCAYCGQAAVLTNEHVFPDCFQRTFDAISIAKTPSGEKAITGAQEVRDVCGPCNNGPLSDFCQLNQKYFATIIHKGDFVRFEYDGDRLLRALLKISYNVARTRKWPLSEWHNARQYILGRASCPHGFRVFVQLMVPTPATKSDLPYSQSATEITPLPINVAIDDVSSLPGLWLLCSVSAWSYRFFVLRENEEASVRMQKTSVTKWLRSENGAIELTRRSAVKIYASSVTVLDVLRQSPILRGQVSKARMLKAETDAKKSNRNSS
jgi:hypothetical protein